MRIWVRTEHARAALTEIVNAKARAAAGSNILISRREQQDLHPYLQAKAEQMRVEGGTGTRVRADDLVEFAMQRAMTVWERYNPPGDGLDSAYLSRAEVAAVRRENPDLGVLTLRAYEQVRARIATERQTESDATAPLTLNFTTNHPNAELKWAEGAFELHSDRSAAGMNPRATATLAFDGHQVVLQAAITGAFRARGLDTLVPEGYFATFVASSHQDNAQVERFVIEADPPGTLSSDEARDLARQGLIDYLKGGRMRQPDWQTFFPSTWSGAVGRGIMNGIDNFGKRDATVFRKQDSYVITGPGPFELYTEVELSKHDGAVLRTYVEVD